jgi:hypothetical protein
MDERMATLNKLINNDFIINLDDKESSSKLIEDIIIYTILKDENNNLSIKENDKYNELRKIFEAEPFIGNINDTVLLPMYKLIRETKEDDDDNNNLDKIVQNIIELINLYSIEKVNKEIIKDIIQKINNELNANAQNANTQNANAQNSSTIDAITTNSQQFDKNIIQTILPIFTNFHQPGKQVDENMVRNIIYLLKKSMNGTDENENLFSDLLELFKKINNNDVNNLNDGLNIILLLKLLKKINNNKIGNISLQTENKNVKPILDLAKKIIINYDNNSEINADTLKKIFNILTKLDIKKEDAIVSGGGFDNEKDLYKLRFYINNIITHLSETIKLCNEIKKDYNDQKYESKDKIIDFFKTIQKTKVKYDENITIIKQMNDKMQEIIKNIKLQDELPLLFDIDIDINIGKTKFNLDHLLNLLEHYTKNQDKDNIKQKILESINNLDVSFYDSLLKKMEKLKKYIDNNFQLPEKQEKSKFEKILDEYNNEKDSEYPKNIQNEDNLYEKIRIFNLDPSSVLKISFQDKSIFIAIILIIRFIIVSILELCIDYNVIKTLHYSIIIYGILYLLTIIIFIIMINYDEYKLRILINYLNMHSNSSKIYLHIMLFTFFIVLIYMMVKSQDTLNNFGDFFDFTHIYKHIYNITEANQAESYSRLTQEEKLKLQYRIEIITMIVFIFTSFLVMVL